MLATRTAERELASRVVEGDEGAFESLYRDHSPRVFALCLRLSGSRDRAAELTQDVFVQLWRRIASWRGESALSTWIHRVTVNHVISTGRRDQKRDQRELRSLDEGGDDESASKPVAGVARPVAIHDAIDLERAIAGLPPGARTVFVLHDVEGYRHEEIAKMTGTAEGTCRAQLHRARKLLMEALEK